jgi:hypothetical protein
MKIWIATPSITDSGLAFSVLSDEEAENCQLVKNNKGFSFYVEKDCVEEYMEIFNGKNRMPSYLMDFITLKYENEILHALTGCAS